jgi:hypothetical protein
MSTKKKTAEILKRWLALDAHIHYGDLSIIQFAKRFKVSEKTIRRDIESFKALGWVAYWEKQEGGEYIWRYSYGPENRTPNGKPLPMFTKNIRWEPKKKKESALH